VNILFIRGGALGDFIISLPTLGLCRERWPDARIECLGHPRQCEIALNRHYLNGARSVNHGPLSAFFTPHAVLDPEWMDYIGDFDLVLSYFYDPDGLFRHNLERCKPVEILTLPPRVPEDFGRPAARYFAEILSPLGLALGGDASSKLYLTEEDRAGARMFTPKGARMVAIHPGSGGESKNWPVKKWEELGRRLVAEVPGISLLLIEGEADAGPARFLAEAWKDLPLSQARLFALPLLAGLLAEAALYIGHDSGITHLAAASSPTLPVVTLFGATDPVIWAPPRPGVHVIEAMDGLGLLSVDEVLATAKGLLQL
jgi:heptosyltransferase-2